MTQQNNHKEILVYAHWAGFTEPVLMGHLHAEIIRGSEVFSFEYLDEWLQNDYAQILDPELQHFTGRQYSQNQNFGVFLDSSPDRWGRVLMKRRETILARMEKRTPRRLLESDFLLGVFDEYRMGGLRFKEDYNGPFLNDDISFSTPPRASISDLEHASLKIEKDVAGNDPDYLDWLNMLIAPGSSLGGARPKAGVIDTNGELWIAKFPSVNDTKDVGAWEMVVHDLAVKCGIKTAAASVKKFSSNHHTYLTKRFDRTRDTRLHFSSAMTMLGYTDGEDSLSGVSYLNLADFIIANGADVDSDLEELWRRIVFNISVSNTDDHLRNHGFLLSKKGWHLSPAYDLNPNENGAGLSLNISEDDNSQDIGLALKEAEYFRVSKNKAAEIINTISGAISAWREIAKKYNIPKIEQDYMASAFKI
jgi:serine/threonine-protein kinase HipA